MAKRHSFHRLLSRAVATFNRNPWSTHALALVPRTAEDTYAEDGLWTYHSHPFIGSPNFDRAYQRAIAAGGFDYRIRWRVHTILWAATVAASTDGAFVECGTGRGFMAAAICEFLNWGDRPFYLYDTFEPALREGDSPSPYYATNAEAVRSTFAHRLGVRLIVGRLPGTLGDEPEEIAFLHVDLNHAATEDAVVRHFWPRISPGGVLVYDDYGFPGFESSRHAADDLAKELGFAIFACPTGQGVVIKQCRRLTVVSGRGS